MIAIVQHNTSSFCNANDDSPALQLIGIVFRRITTNGIDHTKSLYPLPESFVLAIFTEKNSL